MYKNKKEQQCTIDYQTRSTDMLVLLLNLIISEL